MTKVLVLYYSAYGHIETMANAVAEGAREAGATVDFERNQFRNALDVDGGAGLAGAFRHRVRHRLDMAVGRIIKHENFRHDLVSRVCSGRLLGKVVELPACAGNSGFGNW